MLNKMSSADKVVCSIMGDFRFYYLFMQHKMSLVMRKPIFPNFSQGPTQTGLYNPIGWRGA